VPFVTAHGIRLAYELSGPAGGPACVLIHGWTGSIVEWAAVIRPLNDLGWRTLAIDGPGHGRSEAPAAREMYTMHALADLHHEVARVLGYSPAVVMGFSMGGAIAEEYALRHPRSVRGLVLLGSAGGDWIDEEAQAEIDEALPVAFSERMTFLRSATLSAALCCRYRRARLLPMSPFSSCLPDDYIPAG
jgi:pimeloyl-ACP methyl ester carboxylesterase